MSEVDRLSNSGLYPALPLGDQRRKDGSPQPRRQPAADPATPHANTPQTPVPRPPRSLIDEYA